MSDEFEGKEQIESLEEFERLLNQGRKDFTHCVFSFPFLNSDVLTKALTDKSYTFSGVVFAENVVFDTILSGVAIDEPISFLNVTFKKLVVFSSTKFSGDLHVSNCIFKNTVLFNLVKFSGSLHLLSCTFHNLAFVSSSMKDLFISNNNFLSKLKISHLNSQKSDSRPLGDGVEKIKINRFSFTDNVVGEKAVIRFGYLDVNYFYFENMNNPVNSEINIGECNFNKFILRNLRNKGKFRIYRINAEKAQSQYREFKLTDSSLGDSEFQNVNLACYKKVIVQNNSLSDLKYTGVQWPDSIETEETETETDTDKKKRDTYRDLKSVAQKNNDAPQAIEFYAKEMRAYSDSLSGEPGKTMDKIILHVNRLTNNFGLDWWLPIRWILGAGGVLYLLLLLLIDSSGCAHGIGYELKKFPVFLNPTHKNGAEFICGQWGFFAYSIDLSFRVIEATLIYQTIIAFRKFTRKL